MPSQEVMKAFLQSKDKWDDHFDRPASDYKDALYDANGKWTGPVADASKIDAARHQASKIPLTEEAFKAANRLANGHVGTWVMDDHKRWTVAEVEAFRANFTTRVDKLGFIVNYGDDGRVNIYQFGLLFLQFRDPMTASTWLTREEKERAMQEADRERVASQPAWASSQTITFNEKPVSREEFQDLQEKFGVVNAQLETIKGMLEERK